MDPSQKYEVGRLEFRSERLAPTSELLRWSCEQRMIAYVERPVALPRSSPMLPQVFTPNRVISGIEAALNWVDRRCRVGERIFGETDFERDANRAFLKRLLPTVAQPATLLWYFHALAEPKFLDWAVKANAPSGRSLSAGLGTRSLKRRLRQMYVSGAADPAAAESTVDAALTQIESDIQQSETPFLSGSIPGPRDIIFAALASPLVLPPNSGAGYPKIEQWPAPLREMVEKYRDRPAGRLALAVYDQARPQPQPPLPAPAYGPTFFERLLSPRVVRFGSRMLVSVAPKLKIGKHLILSGWHDVTEVLSRDNDFLIGPINGARIEAVGGAFMLGMDRSPDLMEQREHVYAALRDANKKNMLAILSEESRRLLNDAIADGGRIDVVNGYARLVAGRTAADLFGIVGPTEQDYLRVIRAIFHETFLNQFDDPAVKKLGIAASLEIRDWIESEIGRRMESGHLGDDVLGQLLRTSGHDLDAVRRMLGGCLVGAVDTTATAVANIIAEVVKDTKLKEAMVRDLDHPRRLTGWCWEALRRQPHNWGMLRQAGQHAKLNGAPVEQGTQVVLLTVAAMHDPCAFERPKDLVPDRPTDRYFHFGGGLHQCAGRDINAIQVPALVRELLRCDVSGRANVRTRGPFPDEFIVTIRAPRVT